MSVKASGLAIAAMGLALLMAWGNAAAASPEPAQPPSELFSPDPSAGSDLPAVSEARVPGHYIVVLQDSIVHPRAVAAAQVKQRDGRLGFVYSSAIKGYSAAGLSKTNVQALRRDPRVKFVEPARRVEALSETAPWGVLRIGAAENPALDIDGIDDVRVDADVAVIDTGIDYTHPDLNVVSRTNCVPLNEEEWSAEQCVDAAGVDGDGHGTHVAGTIGAIDNDFGVVGVAPGVRLHAVRVLNDKGVGYTPWILAGINWVTARASEIEVANMSLGGPGRSPATDAAIKASVEAGVVNVVAAGNSALGAELQSPANSPDAITVSAMVDTDGKAGGEGKSCNGQDDALAKAANWGSNWGSFVDIAAPGACVYSTLPLAGSNYGASSYGTLSGTSMATPHVAGAAAILAAQSNPNNKSGVEAIREQLIAGGSLDWTDTSEDGDYEPLVYVGGTPLSSPEAVTGGWESMEARNATLTGALNTRGLEADFEFEYGPTTAYGETASASTRSQTGSYRSVEADIEGLDPGRTYHYRLALTTPQGTVYGADRALTSSQWSSHAPIGSPPSEDEQLSGVSCPTQDWCMAVDWDYISAGDQRLGSYELKGGQWTYRTMPRPTGGSFPVVKSVSCTSPSYCIAVGRVQLGSIVVQLAETWNGASWSIQSIPAPPTEASQPYARLDDVSCPSVSECMAVGYFKTSESGGSNQWRPHVARLHEGSWTNMFPLPQSSGDLLSVSCPSTSFCAVTGRPSSLIWDGSSWSTHTQPVNARFAGVSCTSSQFCMAVSPEPYAEIWDGTQWSAVERQETDLWGVDCASPDHCIAAGYRYGPRIYPVIEKWDGSNFSPQGSLRENDRFSYFWDIDCSWTSVCAAVGGSEGEPRTPLIATSPDWRPGLGSIASQASPDSAILHGTVNPKGFATSYRFEWGATSSYGNVIPVPDGTVGSGYSPIKVVQSLSGLSSSTTYHYRLVAENDEGTSATEDFTFKTMNLVPTFSKSTGSAGSGNGQFKEPWDVAVNPVNGAVAVADALNNRIQIFNEEGEFIRQFGSVGSEDGQFNEPYGVAFDGQGNVWVADTSNDRIQEFTESGQFIRKFGTSGSGNGALSKPFDVEVDDTGKVWVADTLHKRVQAFSETGAYISKFSVGGYNYGIALDADGDVWTTTSQEVVREYSPAGALLRSFGGFGHENGQLYRPRGIAVDESGNVWVADSSNDRVQIFSPTGEYLAKFGSAGSGSGQFAWPAAIALDPRGNVWVTDKNNARLQRWTWFAL